MSEWSARFWYIVLWDDDRHIAPLAQACRSMGRAQQLMRKKSRHANPRVIVKPRVFWPQATALSNYENFTRRGKKPGAGIQWGKGRKAPPHPPASDMLVSRL